MTWVERPLPLPSLSSLPAISSPRESSFRAPLLTLPLPALSALEPFRRTTSPASHSSQHHSHSAPLSPRHSLMPPPPLPRKRKQVDRRSASPVPDSSASPESHADSEYDPSRARRPKRIQSKASTSATSPPTTGTTTPAAPAGMRIGPNGRPMSREQLRKANHSLIERRRREKINFALSELRGMVPGLGEDGGKGGEFKLEVLERTVEHMRELKAQVAELQDRIEHMARTESEDMDVDSEPPRSRSSNEYHHSGHSRAASRQHSHTPTYPSSHHSSHQSTHSSTSHSLSRQPSRPAYSHSHSHSHSHNPSPHQGSSHTPPSPSMTPPLRHAMSPDPNETEPEMDLPPPLTLAHRTSGSDNTESSGNTASPRPHPPSIASLIASSQPRREVPNPRSSQPSPNIYLPFPTPSPTSPFLTYQGSAASTSSSVTGPPEPSPFMAPLQNISLFGGALLDTPNTLDGDKGDRKQPSPPHLAMPPPGHRDLGAEEAANLLLAISSPETLRPSKTGSTPIMSALSMPPGQRRLDADSDDFSLDGGTASKTATYYRPNANYRPRQGKTARDILRM